MKDHNKTIMKLEKMARRMRRRMLDMSLSAGANSSHFGGGLSIIDITATLYGEIMNLNPENPEWEERDRFILSKGHGVLGYYTALSEVGFIPEEDLETFEKNGTYLYFVTNRCYKNLVSEIKGNFYDRFNARGELFRQTNPHW